MAYGLELHLDPTTEATVWGLRRALAAAGLPTLAGTRERPHLSLVRFDPADPAWPAAAGRALAALAAGEAPLDVVFPCLGVFTHPAAFVFLAPVVSEALLALHRRVHAWAASVGTPAQLPAAVAACRGIPFPLAARGTHFGMTHAPPVVEWHSLELGTGAARDA